MVGVAVGVVVAVAVVVGVVVAVVVAVGVVVGVGVAVVVGVVVAVAVGVVVMLAQEYKVRLSFNDDTQNKRTQEWRYFSRDIAIARMTALLFVYPLADIYESPARFFKRIVLGEKIEGTCTVFHLKVPT